MRKEQNKSREQMFCRHSEVRQNLRSVIPCTSCIPTLGTFFICPLNLNQTKYPATTQQQQKHPKRRRTTDGNASTNATTTAAEAVTRRCQPCCQRREVPSTADASTAAASVSIVPPPPSDDGLRLFCSRHRPGNCLVFHSNRR